MRTALHKTVVVSLFALCLGCIVTLVVLDELFYKTRPRNPAPEAGLIYGQWVHHGAFVYLTRTEKLPFDYLPLICPVFGFVAFLLNQRWQVSRNPPKNISRRSY
jgi:hypothetical protein